MKRDFEADDLEFSREIGQSLATHRATNGRCPHPDLVMAALAGVQVDNLPKILQHVDSCGLCQQLTRDLSEQEHAGVSEEEDRRIRARWGNREPKRQGWRAWVLQPFAIGAAAAVLVLVTIFVSFRPLPENVAVNGNTNENNSTSVAPAPAKERIAFVLSKAAIKAPAAAVLTFRSGSGDGGAFLNEFAGALEPYGKDDFAEAARRLEPLAEKYGETALVHYYLGVSRLFLGQNEAALESLEAARSGADASLRDDISWYLALALDRVGRTQDARREVADLCSRNGDHQKQACIASDELK